MKFKEERISTLNDKTRMMVRKKQTLLLVAPYSTLILMHVALAIKGKLLHIAASAICLKTWPLRLRYASNSPCSRVRYASKLKNLEVRHASKRGETIKEVGQKEILGEEGLSIVTPFLRYITP
jgi:hypothetical protein